jgi:hypothetical protein
VGHHRHLRQPELKGDASMVSWIVLLGLLVVVAGIAAVFFFWKGE